MTKLSHRATAALEILKGGGKFVERLERNSYTNRAVFKHRLLMRGDVVRGYGHGVFRELYDAGLLAQNFDAGTSVSSYYELCKDKGV
jgi:hypothetical protein